MRSGPRRFVGNLFVVLGALNLVDFFAPRPIPTVGISAFLVGALCVGLGLFIRADRDEGGKIQWGRLGAAIGAEKKARKESRRVVDAVEDELDPHLTVQVLRLAADRRTPITVAQVSMELDVGLDEAEAALDACAAKGIAVIDVDEATGRAAYRFPEFQADGDREYAGDSGHGREESGTKGDDEA